MTPTRYLHHRCGPNAVTLLDVDTSVNGTPRKLSLSDSAVYRIRVQGVIEPSWSDLMHGMAISPLLLLDERQRELRQTELFGKLADQAALIGLINTLYSLGLPLVSVTCVWQSGQ
jgi:hypothetical protein